MNFKNSIKQTSDVICQEIDGTCVLLNLANESYYGLDETSYDFYQKLLAAKDIETAFQTILAEYSVSPEALKNDLEILISSLVAEKIVEIHVA